MTEQARPNAVFQVATMPARLLSRFRTDLGASLREDAATFARPAARLFLVLVALAIAYPIIASVVHAQAPGPSRAEPITYALAPFFYRVFAESQPFMIAAFAIGAFSPGLGVLFIATFVPADLVAAAVHCGGCGSGGPPELVAPQGMAMWQGPIVARLISYGVLWILAVEIPLRVRRWATAWASRGGRQPSVLVSAAAAMVGTAVLAFFWARSVGFLIQPVFAWTVLGEISIEATMATWDLWPILVISVTVIAGLAAIWPRPVRLPPDSATPMVGTTGRVRSMPRALVRQTVAVVALTGLFAGFATNLLEAAILIGGLLAAGPAMSLALPRLRVPQWLPPARTLARWIMAMVIALAVSQLILTLAGETVERPYLVLVITLAVVAPLFRLLLDAGAAQSIAADSHGPLPGPPAVITSAIALFAVLGWLALPEVALADNWWSPNEIWRALHSNIGASFALMGGALFAIGAAMSWAWREGFLGGEDWSDKPELPPLDSAKRPELYPWTRYLPWSNWSPPPPESGDSAAPPPEEAPPSEAPPPEPPPRPPGIHGPPQ